MAVYTNEVWWMVWLAIVLFLQFELLLVADRAFKGGLGNGFLKVL